MNLPIRVLVVDDHEDDALLIVDELKRSGYEPDYIRVDTPEAMNAALASQSWEIIIADNKLPSFGERDPKKVLEDAGVDTPVVLVSRAAAENGESQSIIAKESLSRLGPEVARRLAEEACRESEERYRLITETAIDAIITSDEEGTILLVNPAAERIFGYSAQEMIGRHISMLMPERYRMRALASIRHYMKTGEKLRPWQDIEVMGLHKAGREIFLETSYSDYVMKGKHYFTGTFRDISERKEIEAHKREFYRRTIMAATEGKLVISEPEEIEAIAGEVLHSWRIASLEDIETARGQINELALKDGMEESRVYHFQGCAMEALANVHKHAGSGTTVLYRVPDGLLLVVSDTGPGIEALALPDVALTRGYTTAISLGMGYKIMIEFADRIYLATSPKGTTVAIQMGLQAAPKPTDALLGKLTAWQT